MWSETVTFILHTVWPILPEITVGLRFATALVGFILTMGLLLRRIRRWLRRVARWFARRR
jgi:hypothetical protein